MGLIIPRTDLAGFSLGPPQLWPMGIGHGCPRWMERVDGTPERYEFAWDADRRLIAVSEWFHRPVPSMRTVLIWRGGMLDRIQSFAADSREECGDAPDREEIWSWDDHGRPTHVRTAHFEMEGGVETTWTWEPEGMTAQLTWASPLASGDGPSVSYDAAGRLVRVEGGRSAHGDDGRLVTCEWTADGFLRGALERSGPGLIRSYRVDYRYDDRGWLVGQRREVDGDQDLWRYRYDDGASP